MRIAVIQHIPSSDYSEYVSSLIDEQAKQAGYEVKTWINSVPVSQQHIPEDAVVNIYAETGSSFWVKYFHSFKLPSLLKKLNVKVVINLDGYGNPSLHIPQILSLPQEIFIERKNNFYALIHKQLLQSMKCAKNAFVYTEKLVDEISSKTSSPNKIIFIPFTAPLEFRSFEWHEKILPKAQHAENNEYFISVLEDEDEKGFVTLLKAFSKFKKWHQSNMHLVLFPKFEMFSFSIKQKLETYKYKDNVRLIENFEEYKITSVMASAYAYIHLANSKADLEVLSAAIKCTIPIISQPNEDVRAYAQNAVIFSKDDEFESLGDCLNELFKNENLHGHLHEAAKQRVASLNREVYEKEVWKTILNAAQH